jgi:hypothetical protein
MKNLKKKVAILLALVMMISLVPMNVFGARVFPVSTAGAYGEWQNFNVEFNANLLNGLVTDTNPVLVTFEFGGIPSWAMNQSWGFRLGSHQEPSRVPVVTNDAGLNITALPMGATGFVLRVENTSPGAIMAASNAMVRVGFDVMLGGGDVGDAHVTVTVANTDTVILNQARLARFPVSGVTAAVSNPPAFNEILRVPDILITENSANQFISSATGEVFVWLAAPEGYVWRRNLMGVDFAVTNPRAQGRTAALAGTTFGSNDATTGNVLAVTVNLGDRGTLNALPGAIRLRGLFLVPEVGAATTGNVGVTVRVGTNLADLSGANWDALSSGDRARRSAGTVTVGTRSLDAMAGYVTIRRVQDNPANIRSGANAPTGNLGAWHTTVKLTESIHGAWDTGLTLSRFEINLPSGARIADAQISYGDADWVSPDDFETIPATVMPAGSSFGTDPVARINRDANRIEVYLPRVRTDDETAQPGAGARRSVEVRIRIEARPGFVAMLDREDITLTMSGNALTRLNGDNTILAANVFDPITVELANNTANIIDADHLGLVSVAAFGDIVITETNGGMLRGGSFISIGTADTQIGFLPLEINGWPWVTVEGANGNPTTLAARVDWHNDAHGTGVGGWAVIIDRASVGDNPGRIVIHGLSLAGTMINVPQLFDYDLRVRGTAIAANAAGFGSGSRFYRLPVVNFEETFRETVVIEEPPAVTPPVVQPPAVVEQPVLLTINMWAANLHGVDAPVIEQGGQVFLALRVFANEIAAAQGVTAVVESSRDAQNRVQSTVTAPNAAGVSTTLVSSVGERNALLNSGGNMIPNFPIVAPIVHNDRKYLPLQHHHRRKPNHCKVDSKLSFNVIKMPRIHCGAFFCCN